MIYYPTWVDSQHGHCRALLQCLQVTIAIGMVVFLVEIVVQVQGTVFVSCVGPVNCVMAYCWLITLIR